MKPDYLMLVILGSLSLLSIIPAHANQPTGINITYPTFSTIIYDNANGTNSLIGTGTFQEDNATLTPTITISLDNNQYTPNVNGNTWSISLGGLSGGWHTITAKLSDTISNVQDTVQFLVINGHVAIPKINLLLIQESNTCEKLLQSNITSDCPTLGQLKSYDTSNKFLAGDIVQQSNGLWIREPPHVKGWWNFVTSTGNPVVCVQCDFNFGLIDQAQILFIEPHSFTFASPSPNQYQNTTETYWNGTQDLTRIMQQPTGASTTFNINFDRYVSSDCLTANIAYSPMMLSDTIAYLEGGCKKTNLITNKTLVVPIVPFNTEHCTECHYETWLNQVKHSTDYTMKDPNENPGYAKG